MKGNNIVELKQRLEELYQTQQARLDVGADDLDIREEIAEVEDEIKESEDDINEENNNGNDTNVGSIEDSIEKDIDILNNIKEYMQENIDNGYHKFCYNEQNDEKCVDIINAIDHILSDYKRVLKENEELLEVKVSASAHNRILELERENEYLKETILNLTEKLQEKNKQLENEVMEKNLEIIGKEEYTKASIKDIFDVKIHNFNYLSETDWSETQRIIDKEIANILQQILQELLESEETNDKNNKKR